MLGLAGRIFGFFFFFLEHPINSWCGLGLGSWIPGLAWVGGLAVSCENIDEKSRQTPGREKNKCVKLWISVLHCFEHDQVGLECKTAKDWFCWWEKSANHLLPARRFLLSPVQPDPQPWKLHWSIKVRCVINSSSSNDRKLHENTPKKNTNKGENPNPRNSAHSIP